MESPIEVPFPLPVEIRIAFEEMRRVRGRTQSVILTQAAARNLIRAAETAGFTEDDAVMLAFRACYLGNQDWTNSFGY